MSKSLAERAELVLAARLVLLGAKQPIGEFLAVAGQQPGNLDRAGFVQVAQKVSCALRALEAAVKTIIRQMR